MKKKKKTEKTETKQLKTFYEKSNDNIKNENENSKDQAKASSVPFGWRRSLCLFQPKQNGTNSHRNERILL